MIPFNKPFLTGKETEYIIQAVQSGKICGDGDFTKKCHQFFEQKYGFQKCLLTTSCTDALEMAAILIDTKEGDEIIVPSFTFVSTVNAFVLRGAKIVFADSQDEFPNLDADTIEALITPRTKAIVPVHYAGVGCDMDKIMALAEKYNLYVIEDAAQAVDSFYHGRPLGGIGHLATFSFHETKNIISGEGGMLVINDSKFNDRAEIIREKGTNRSKFYRGEVDKYGWVDIGSSFLPSEIIAAFLYAQLENLDKIQDKRKAIWNKYHEGLVPLEKHGYISLPHIDSLEGRTNNAHMFFITTADITIRTELIAYLRARSINPVFHYLSLHLSPFYKDKHDGRSLPNSDRYTETLLRMPFYYDLTLDEVSQITNLIVEFYNERKS